MIKKNLLVVSVVFFLTSVVFSTTPSENLQTLKRKSNAVSKLNAKEILEKVDNIRAPGTNFVFKLEVVPYKNGKKAPAQKLTVRVKDHDKSLVEFTYPPANKGRLLLMNSNNMWIYIPGTRQPIRISPQQRLLGQVANGDVARVVYSIDYQAKIINRSKKYIKLLLKAKKGNVQYGQIVLFVNRKNFYPEKALFYTKSDRLLKTAYYKDYQEVLGKLRPQLVEIHDELRKGQYTVMKYSGMEMKNTPGSYFQKSYLKHLIR
ncbi:MAG: outer membrane lipoprotein-sorting protein [bacterium]|nr:outer membrane lipoprotein-sorting protein [bacterium]